MWITNDIEVGGSLGIILPAEALDMLGVRGGGDVEVLKLNDCVILRRINAELSEQLRAIDEVLQEDDDALGRLAD